ncbi:MAG: RNA polymerase sigma factor [bacterium]|nr:RNA polymerase sigma factor [bacterium]
MKKQTLAQTLPNVEAYPLPRQQPIASAKQWSDMKEAEDKELIALASKGDSLAFHTLVERYRTRVAAISYQIIGNYEDARDVSQEVFVKLFRSLSTFDADKKFFTWLYRMTVNASIDFLRSRRKRNLENSIEEQPEYYQETIAHPDGDGFSRFESKELAGIFHEIADRLNPNQRTAFALCDLEGFTPAEAAAIMGCPKVTLRWYLHEARKRVRNEMLKLYPEYARK